MSRSTPRWRRATLLTLISLVSASAFAKPQAASPAAAWIDSIGVNTHFGNALYPENAYANKQIGAKLAALGVRHIRDHTHSDAGLRAVDDLHRRHGVRATLVLGETTRSPADIVKLLKAHPAYEAVEGLNEPDFTARTYKTFTDDRKTATYAATRAFQEELYAAVKNDPKTKSIPVLSPAMGRSNRSQFLVPIPFDVASMHRYAWEGKAAMEPGFGLKDAIADLAALRGDKPLWATESGYYNEPPRTRARCRKTSRASTRRAWSASSSGGAWRVPTFTSSPTRAPTRRSASRTSGCCVMTCRRSRRTSR
jgi:hypothetical protein